MGVSDGLSSEIAFCKDDRGFSDGSSLEIAFCEDERGFSDGLSSEIAFCKDDRGFSDGLKGLAAEGDSPEKCATLGIMRGRGPQAQRSGRGRVATFSGESPSAAHLTPLAVAWGAVRWTSNDENGRKRRLGCWKMDLKRRKWTKTSLGVPANGPQATETGRSVVWGAVRWTSNDENRRKRRLGCWKMDLKRRERVKKSSGSSDGDGGAGRRKGAGGNGVLGDMEAMGAMGGKSAGGGTRTHTHGAQDPKSCLSTISTRPQSGANIRIICLPKKIR